MQEMGFLVDDRSVIGVSNLVVASDYKDANVPIAKFRQRREDRKSSEMNVVEESWREWYREKRGGNEKIGKYVVTLNGLGGSKHRQREEINELDR